MERKLSFFSIFFLTFAGVLVHCNEQVAATKGTCEGSTSAENIFTLTVNRKLNHSNGEWVRNFAAQKIDSGKSSGNLELEASQGSVECNGKRIVHIKVMVREVGDSKSSVDASENEDKLVFHHRHGRNAVLLNDRRSVQKLDLDDTLNAVVFSHRALRNDELFEVRLDKRLTKTNHCFALGVMTHLPETVEILPSMHQHKNGTWVYHNNAIYGSNRELSKYGQNLNTIQPRDRLGVMRREDGTIHFFMNGVDLGRALANVPEPVYGIFEVWYDAVKGTIVY